MNPLCGHIRSVPDHRDRLFGASPLADINAVTSTNVDNRVHCPRVVQQIANNCVAHASRSAAYATALAAHLPINLPSVAFPYAGARMKEGPPGAPLEDRGSMVRLMYQFLAEWGFIADNRWPELAETVNMVPPDDCFAAGEGASLKAYYAIPEGPGMAETVEAAVRRQQFPVFAMQVDDRWANIGSDVWDGPGGAVLGGHAMFVAGYFGDLDAFLIQNSWGTDFGFDGGFGLISRAAFDRYVYEAWVQTVEPRVVW